VISSNGTTAGTAIVWFVQKPATSSDQYPGTPVTLRAYSASNLQQQLVSITAGTWTHAVNSNANIVPTVAKGKVYVASNQQLQVFGLFGQQGQTGSPAPLAASAPEVVTCPLGVARLASLASSATAHDFYGTICQASSNEIRVVLRSGCVLSVEISGVFVGHRPVLLTPGRTIHVRAMIGEDRIVHAWRVFPSQAMSANTPADR
jgi:hypothetical protein